MMHLIITIVKDISILLQILWFENKKYTLLVIYRKKMKLQQLQNISLIILKKTEIQLQKQIKIELKEIKNWNWKQFDAENNLFNIKNEYNFILKMKNECFK